MCGNWSEEKNVSQHRANSFTDTVEVCLDQRDGRLVRRFQKLGFQFRGGLEGLFLLLTQRSQDIVGQFAGVSTDARADLFLQELFKVFCERNCHNRRIKYKG